MKITIVTVGSRGDVEPYIALGLGLRHSGHEVSLATHSGYETAIRQRGLGFFAVEGDPRQILDQTEGQAWLRTGGNPLAFLNRLSQYMSSMLLQAVEDIWRACQDADAAVYSLLGGLGAFHVIEKLGIPFVPAFLVPSSPTGEFPSLSFPTRIPLRGLFNRTTHSLSEQFMWRLMAKPINKAREAVLGLPPLSKPWYSEGHKTRIPIVYGFSPSVVPKPRDWGEWLHITGYWFLNPTPDWRPPSGLVDFLASGSPPVYVGFGSMNDRDRDRNTEIVLKALALARCRGVLATGWGGLSNADLPDDVFKVEDVPHSWLFPQMAAVVHHCGAGTTAAGIRAGVPTIPVPFFSDQPFWAERVYRLRVGPKPIPHRHLSAQRLAESIRTAVNDSAMRARAAALGERVRSEDGTSRAVQLLNRLVGQAWLK